MNSAHLRLRAFVSPAAAAFTVLLVCQLAWLSHTFPSAEEYRPGADEGTYFRDASLIVDHGLVAFRQLGREFVTDPRAQIAPVPVRIGHLLAAAAALRLERSFRALSMLSLLCHGLLGVTTFVFVRRLWNERVAFAAGVLVLASPLGAGLARRALMDTDYCLFIALCFFTFLVWAVKGRRRDFIWFSLALAWATLVREATVLLLPCFVAAAAALKVCGSTRARWRHVAAIALVPVAVGCVHVALFGGIAPVVDIALALRRGTSPEMNPYVRAYNAGPWFEYLVDSLLMSPITTIGFLLYCGWYVGGREKTTATSLIIAFFWAGLLCLSWLPQNPRYLIPLDPLLRVGTALLVTTALAGESFRAGRAAVAAACLLLMVAMDLASFDRLFRRDRIYDPVGYNLVASGNLIPSSIHEPDSPMTVEDYLHASRAYYLARDFEAAIGMSRHALALDPANAEAYNDMGAAFAEQSRWREAAAAFEQALRLRPDFSLARHNLAWAHTSLSQLIAERQD